MPTEMHYHEGDPGGFEAHRLQAQLYLVEILGIGEDDLEKWIGEEGNGKKFAELVDEDPDWVSKLAERSLTEAEISFLRDQFQADLVDTGDEDHDEEPFIRAA
jgi:hypothetical protein